MRRWVALILALCVVIFFLAGMTLPIALRILRPDASPASVELGAIWADLVKVIVGGLIGYIAGGAENER